jgi:CheY-like chemotaxis protein
MKHADATDFDLPDFIEVGNEDERAGAGSTLPQDLFPLGVPAGPAASVGSQSRIQVPDVDFSQTAPNDFSATLPPEQADAASAATVRQGSEPAPAQAIVAGLGSAGRLRSDGPQPKRVLVVDDDLTARLYMRSRLMLRGNVQLFEACSGPEGLKILQTQPAFDAVLLDVDMGLQNGYEVCKAVRNWVRNQGGLQPKIYIITSRTSMLDKMRAKMAGADAFLSKPPMPAELAKLLVHL